MVWFIVRRSEVETLVEASRRFVFGMHRYRPDAGDVSDRDGAPHHIPNQPRADPLALPAKGYRQPRQQQHGYRMAG